MQINFVYICTFICFLVYLGRIILPLFSPWSSKMIMVTSSKASLAASDLVDSSSFIGVNWNCFQKLLIGLPWLSIWLVVFLEVLFGCLLNPPITVLLIWDTLDQVLQKWHHDILCFSVWEKTPICLGSPGDHNSATSKKGSFSDLISWFYLESIDVHPF